MIDYLRDFEFICQIVIHESKVVNISYDQMINVLELTAWIRMADVWNLVKWRGCSGQELIMKSPPPPAKLIFGFNIKEMLAIHELSGINTNESHTRDNQSWACDNLLTMR